MNFLRNGFILGLAVISTSTNTMANSEWKNSVEIGLILTSGNTNTQSSNLKAGVGHERGNWRTDALVEALNIKGDEGRLSEKYLVNGKSAYKFSDAIYVFAVAEGEHNPFSGYAYQVGTSLGFGYRLIGNDLKTLDFEGGAGYRETRLRGINEAEGEAVFRLGGKYVHKLSKTSEFSQQLTSAVGELTTITKSISAISAQIRGNLSMKATYTFKNNSVPPEGFEQNDSETAMTLVYSY